MFEQTGLFGSKLHRYSGPDVTETDAVRLDRQLDKVERLMRDGSVWTLASLAAQVGCSENSASARIRDLRKLGYTVDRQKSDRPGIFLYRVAK